MDQALCQKLIGGHHPRIPELQRCHKSGMYGSRRNGHAVEAQIMRGAGVMDDRGLETKIIGVACHRVDAPMAHVADDCDGFDLVVAQWIVSLIGRVLSVDPARPGRTAKIPCGSEFIRD